MYISSRQTDAIQKVRVSTGEVLWTLGGEYGDYDIVDLEGNTWAAGSSVWVGQHNAEYFGDDEFCMFDNQEYQTNQNTSRLLCVKLDETTAKAHVTFTKDMPGYSPHFGDNDRLPTGNQLGIFWPEYAYFDDQYDILATEIDRETNQVAWQMKFCSERIKIDSGYYDRGGNGDGWTSFSIERFYTAPLIWNAVCDSEASTVSFQTTNNFKQNNAYNATYSISDSSSTLVDEKVFMFTPHWRETNVTHTFDSSSSLSGDLTVAVTNQWGDVSYGSVSC